MGRRIYRMFMSLMKFLLTTEVDLDIMGRKGRKSVKKYLPIEMIGLFNG